MPVQIRLCAPAFSIQVPVLDGLGQMFYTDIRCAREVCGCARYFQYAVVRPGRELQFLHGCCQQQLTGRVESTDFLYHFSRHLGIAIDIR